MKVWLKRLFLLIAVILLAAQFYRPSKLNPPVDPRQEIASSVNIHPEVAEIFERSCNDCHSNQTIWPWYSHVAPVSWLIANDVQEGRKELNFSEWASYGPEKSDKLLNKLCKETSRGAMPQFPYSLLHPKAKLTDADVQALCNWTKTIRKSAPTVAEEMSEREED